MASKYTDAELKELYYLALSEGLDQLDPGEKRAVTRWCQRTHHPRPGIEPTATPASAPADPVIAGDSGWKVVAAAPVDSGPRVVVERRVDTPAGTSFVDAAEPARPDLDPEPEPEPARPEPAPVDGGELPEGCEFLGSWPEDAEDGTKRLTRSQLIARVLMAHPGMPAVIARGQSRKQALDMRSRLHSGKFKAYPGGRACWRCGIAPDRERAGRYVVVLEYRTDAEATR
ncbi:hypothetical protein [Bifidobacterium stellenboschense]|uniref:Uncharacterized protein n=1 Tax=Bifidobacterium stellenboschense TaxID=762211 RepID=A0A087DQP5_9BIFI|nr:hypothetical protein [Bifidobacterium stellenboschense]KFI97845.1 hypothetical protein BSTEL_0656 [Bifidobacterium stellenboschense]